MLEQTGIQNVAGGEVVSTFMSTENRVCWVTSDPHFFHANIIKYENRPFKNIDQMNKSIILRWNRIVRPNDLIFILGDFALASKKLITKIVRKLNGYKILVLGNHDKSRKAMLDCGFDEVYDGAIVINDKIIMAHKIYMDIQTINVSMDNWNFYPIPLPTTRQPVCLRGHSHSHWIAQADQEYEDDE